MSLKMKEVDFFISTEVARNLGISQQTLSRWRADGHVPIRRLFRRKSVVFTRGEVNRIAAFANNLDLLKSDCRLSKETHTVDGLGTL